MPEIELLEEIHANTRRMRITYRGRVDGREVAIKCYRKPLFGLLHWAMAHVRGSRIRRLGLAVPESIYSGWLSRMRCFCYATKYLTGYIPMRYALRNASSEADQHRLIELLGELLAVIHQKGVEQSDGNLTNFMINDANDLALVDEDDMRVHRRGKVPDRIAVSNVANVAARLPRRSLVESLLSSYSGAAGISDPEFWEAGKFDEQLRRWKSKIEGKRIKRNISPTRNFD